MTSRPRTGQADAPLSRDEFGRRFREHFDDPAFASEAPAIERLEVIAWQAFDQGRKAPRTRKAGEGWADPDYDLSVEWLATHDRLEAAQRRWGEAATPSRVLLICGSPRNDGSCPGEMSKTWRMTQWAAEEVRAAGAEADVLDLSRVTSEYGRTIHPCKGCVSTAMPLCHWPCSCYPNHSQGQIHDWMAEIYERWVAAHGVIVLAPTYWYQSPGVLKSMIDRLVCADGGNPDPTRTHGKKAAEAKAIEAAGWDYPKHLAGRTYGVLVHGGRRGHRGPPPQPVRLAGLDGPDRRRQGCAAGPLHRLLRTLREQPRHTGRGQRDAGRDAPCRPGGDGRRRRVA